MTNWHTPEARKLRARIFRGIDKRTSTRTGECRPREFEFPTRQDYTDVIYSPPRFDAAQFEMNYATAWAAAWGKTLLDWPGLSVEHGGE